MKTRPNYPLLFLLLGLAVHLRAQQAPTSVFDFLTATDNAPVELAINLDSLQKYRKTITYLNAELKGGDGLGTEFKVEVRSRGKYRRKRCELPPLKLKFKKSALRKHDLDTLNEIKLVIPCSDDPTSEEQVLREYTAYRIYETLTPYHVRARLIELKMVNTGAKGGTRTMTAMLVEHDEQVAKRLGGTIIQEWGIKAEQMHTDEAALMLCFEYLIGNTDFDITAFRNNYQFVPNGDTKIITIPFDFDFSGLVNAPYASPNSETPLKNVRDRCLMKSDLPAESHQKALQTVRQHQTEIMALCQNKGLRKKTSAEMTAYLDHFFQSTAGLQEVPPVLPMPAK
jgi:hypothetical protein